MFQTGAVVPETGIYRIVHDDHRLPHEVVILRGGFAVGRSGAASDTAIIFSWLCK
jgi:hypothetical protein